MLRKNLSLGLIGYPLGHSLSPQIHGAALQAVGISGKYSLYPISPDPERQAKLVSLINHMRDGVISGLNVTIPHKQNVIPLLDELTPAARTIGAVNTIFLQDDKLVGDNTDAPGFWMDLQKLLYQRKEIREPSSGLRPSALVLGAGGSTRAVAYALLMNGYRVTIAARRINQAQELCDQLSVVSDQLSAAHLDHRSLISDHWSLIVNTTPVGMHPHTNASPWPVEVPLPQKIVVYDLVYNPRETMLVKQAHAAGLPADTGLGMLVEQAALAFERWTGLEAPRETMRKAVNF